jgi:hypothetical protein
MVFQSDRRFDSLTEAFTYILGQYSLQPNAHVWDQSTSGLVYPRELPRFLFRGECGDFETTTDSARRLQAAALTHGFRLSPADLVKLGKLIICLANRLCQEPYSLDRLGAVALLQHYGLPSRIVDFTGNLGLAFAFAATGKSSTGRVAVMPYASCQTVRFLELNANPWAERAQRQAAYGVVMTDQLADLKSEAARSRLNIKWYEFAITPSDRDYFKEISGTAKRAERSKCWIPPIPHYRVRRSFWKAFADADGVVARPSSNRAPLLSGRGCRRERSRRVLSRFRCPTSV